MTDQQHHQNAATIHGWTTTTWQHPEGLNPIVTFTRDDHELGLVYTSSGRAMHAILTTWGTADEPLSREAVAVGVGETVGKILETSHQTAIEKLQIVA